VVLIIGWVGFPSFLRMRCRVSKISWNPGLPPRSDAG
jgi:hypothetical protein